MSSTLNWPAAALADEDLSARTTMHVGGRAQWLLEPANPDELQRAWVAARERGFDPRILGGGANLIVEDGLLPGVVIATDRLKRCFRPMQDASDFDSELPDVRVAPRERDVDPRLIVWCGTSMPALVRTATDLGWSGLECLAGVPGNLGGGVAMNAGGRWGEMWDVVDLVRVLDQDGAVHDLPHEQCTPRYRNGGLGSALVVAAILRLRPATVAEVRERTREYLTEKRRNQPVTEWSAGCVFKNPDPAKSNGCSAGKLIEEVGAKGLVRGDAIVSPLHGNFILNRGAATASDVLTLIEDVRDLVAQKTGIALETEVKIWRAR
jgi:UDP-N-acetylmuramate dehydrogenase